MIVRVRTSERDAREFRCSGHGGFECEIRLGSGLYRNGRSVFQTRASPSAFIGAHPTVQTEASFSSCNTTYNCGKLAAFPRGFTRTAFFRISVLRRDSYVQVEESALSDVPGS